MNEQRKENVESKFKVSKVKFFFYIILKTNRRKCSEKDCESENENCINKDNKALRDGGEYKNILIFELKFNFCVIFYWRDERYCFH